MNPIYPWNKHHIHAAISSEALDNVLPVLEHLEQEGNPFFFFNVIADVADQTKEIILPFRNSSWIRPSAPSFLFPDPIGAMTGLPSKEWRGLIEKAKSGDVLPFIVASRDCCERQRLLLNSQSVLDEEGWREKVDSIRHLQAESIQDFSLLHAYDPSQTINALGGLLHAAVEADNIEVLDALLSSHYPSLIRNLSGLTATDVAIQSNRWDAAQMLLCMNLSTLSIPPGQFILEFFEQIRPQCGESEASISWAEGKKEILQYRKKWKTLSEKVQWALGVQDPLGDLRHIWRYEHEKAVNISISQKAHEICKLHYNDVIPIEVKELMHALEADLS